MMTAAHKGILSMGLEKETPPKGTGDAARVSGVDDRLSNPPQRPVEVIVPARPRKLVALHWLTVFCVVAAVTFILTRDQIDGNGCSKDIVTSACSC
jgi:cytochrome b561